MSMASQRVPHDVIKQKIALHNEWYQRRLNSQGFDSDTEKIITILLRSHGICAPKLKAKLLVNTLDRLGEGEPSKLNEELFDVFQTIYGKYDGFSFPREAYLVLYVLQRIYGVEV